jgi:hypothetical protein
MRSDASRIRSAGNVTGDGRPPANEMTSGRSVTFRISRIAELVSLRARSESCQAFCGRSLWSMKSPEYWGWGGLGIRLKMKLRNRAA